MKTNKNLYLMNISAVLLLISFGFQSYPSSAQSISNGDYCTDKSLKFKATVSNDAGKLYIRFVNTCATSNNSFVFVEKTKELANSTIKMVDPVDPENYIILKYTHSDFTVIRSSVPSIISGIIQLNTPYNTINNILLQQNGCIKSIAFINSTWIGESDILTSCDGRYKLKFQNDGNLVIYKNNSPVWASQTTGKGVQKLMFQTDGNLVMYNRENKPIWASNSWGKSAHRLIMQNDGNLVIYNCTTAPIWSSDSYERNK
jgi:hypothetical protein